MKTPSVKLKIRIRQGSGKYRYVNPIWLDAKRGTPKLKPLYAEVDGKPEHHPEATYAIRFQENGIRKYENVGSDADVAAIKLNKKTRALAATAAGVEVVAEETRRSFSDAVKEYISETEELKSHKTFLAYQIAIKGFEETCKKSTLEDIDRKDVLTYILTMEKAGLKARTVRNRIDNLKTFFLHFKLAWPLETKDMPKFTEKMVRAYDDNEIRAIMAAANPEEFELLSFLLCTGGREKDVQFARWSNIKFTTKKFWIEEDTDIGYTPKDREEAAIPIPDYLIDLLRARKRRYPESQLIFPTQSGKPNGHLLRTIKKLALRAGLNCGFCISKSGECCDKHPVCKEWILHKWRKTFATKHHEAGVPVRKIQKWLRHSDLETTLRYLDCGDDESPATRQKVNATFSDVFAPTDLPKSA